MKKIAFAALALTVLMLLTSCGPKMLGYIPFYIGGEVSDADHEFTKEEFRVLVNYDDGTDVEITDYKIVGTTVEDGYFIIEFEYKNRREICFVPVTIEYTEN